jgi:outer membrane protein TolC
MFATYNKLGKLSVLGEQQARLQVEQTVAQVISMYYDIIRQKKTYAVLENTLEVTEERIRIAEVKADLGSGSQFDLLQARADLNADRAALLAQEVALQNSKVSLNELLGRNVNEAFVVAEDIPLREQLNYANLVQSAISNNLDLAAARTGQDVLELELKEIQSERFPELQLNMSYGYGRNESGAGFLQFNETDGFNYGLTARVNLFDGFNTNRRAENTRIRIRNQELAIDQQRQQVQADLTRVYQRYTNALRLVELESENLKYAEQSQEIALERFQLGTINSLELREAQRTLNNAENRLIQAEFEAKIAETELLRLSGMLTQTAGR